MDLILRAATSIETPLALAGLVFGVILAVLLALIKKGVFPKLSERSGVAILKQLIWAALIVTIIVTILGFVGFLMGRDKGSGTPQTDVAELVTRKDTACRWVWVFLGRYSEEAEQYQIPPTFRFSEEGSLRNPIPRSGDFIVITSSRSQIVNNYALANANEKCAKMLDPPALYRPERASQFEAGDIPENTKVLVNQVAKLPSPEEDPFYVWALVGAPQ